MSKPGDTFLDALWEEIVHHGATKETYTDLERDAQMKAELAHLRQKFAALDAERDALKVKLSNMEEAVKRLENKT